jgi:DNA repair exonuclease SbcCD ATPase subunit
MDIEKLIEQLKNLEACAYGYHINGEVLGMDCSDFEQVMVDAADEISKVPTLQAENEKLRAGLNDLRTQWDMYGGDEGITSTFAELEQARAEITRLKHYEDKRHDCPIVCAKREIIKAHEELEAAQNERDMWREGMEDCQQSILELEAELEEAKRNQCLGADCPWRHTAI